MKVFLDTNVIIDFYAQREEFYRPASIIIDLAERKEIEIVVSVTTFVNAFYILRKKYDLASLYESMQGLFSLCQTSHVDKEIIYNALSSKWDDFEDCTQVLSASTLSADIIITRNPSDFSQSQIKVATPIEFLNQYFTCNHPK